MTGLDTRVALSRQWLAARPSLLLSRTLFGAKIALRGQACGEGFGVCLSRLRQSECRVCPQRRNGYEPEPLRVPLRLFRFGIMGLDQPQRCNAKNPPPYMCAHARACAIMRATVAALRRCAFSLLSLHLPEKKEENRRFPLHSPATPVGRGVAVGVAGGVNPLKSLEKRGF